MNPNSMPVASRECAEKPKWREMAALIPVIEKWYEDPEHEKEFREWMEERAGKAG